MDCCNVLFYDIHYTSTRYEFRWVQSENLYRILKLQPLIARYLVCYYYNRDVFCVYSVIENGLFPFLKIVNFPHVLVRKNAAFLILIFHFHKMIYNYFCCSLFSFFFLKSRDMYHLNFSSSSTFFQFYVFIRQTRN